MLPPCGWSSAVDDVDDDDDTDVVKRLRETVYATPGTAAWRPTLLFNARRVCFNPTLYISSYIGPVRPARP